MRCEITNLTSKNHQGRYSFSMLLLSVFLLMSNGTALATQPELNSLKSLLQKGIMLYDAGQLDESEAIFRKVLYFTNNDKNLSPSIEAAASNELANVYKDKENYEDAERLYRKAIGAWEILERKYPEKIEVKINLITTLNNLAIVYLRMDDLQNAEKLLNRSVEISEKNDVFTPELGKSYNYLGIVNEKRNNANIAISNFNKALEILHKLSASKEYADTLNNLSIMYSNQGKYDKAEPLLIESIELTKQLDGVNHPSYAQSLNNLSVFYKNTSSFKKAESYALQAINLFNKIFGIYHSEYLNSVNNLVDIYIKQSKYKEALVLVKQTIENKTVDINTALYVLSGAQSSGLIDEKEAIKDSYEVMQLSISTSAAQAVNNLSRRFSTQNKELASLIKQNQDLENNNNDLDKKILSSIALDPAVRDFSLLSKIHSQISVNNKMIKNIQLLISEKFPDYASLSNPLPLTIEQTQKILTDEEGVVSFFSLDKNCFVWIITKSSAHWRQLDVTKSQLNKDILKLRESLTNKEIKPFDAALSFKIYQELFSDIESYLDNKNRLSLLAVGPLTSLTPNVLVTRDPSGKALKELDWFVNKYATAIIPSIFSLQTMRVQAGKSSAQKAMIAFADPIFNQINNKVPVIDQVALRSLPNYFQSNQINYNKLSNSLPQLPSTRDEVLAIGKFVGANQNDIILGNLATEAAVKQATLDQYRIVYFATHGLVAGELSQFAKAGAEPALIFTLPKNPSPVDDGLLQASEVARLNLNADWVVLSACNTASSDGAGAEALSGLAQAFLYAGARSLIVSYWDVLDDATRDLMSFVFESSAQSTNTYHSVLLQKAMIKLLHQAKTDDEAHPRVWAPFVVVGEPDILKYIESNTAPASTNVNSKSGSASNIEDKESFEELQKKQYLTTVYNKIVSNINKSDIKDFDVNRKGVISFDIDNDGNIIETKVYESSGSKEIDRWAQVNVIKSSPFPKPPKNIPHKLRFNFSTK